jgi:uncharacterized protein DUF5678
MIQDNLPNLDDLQTRARLSRGASERATSRVTQFGASLGSTLTEIASGAMISGGNAQRLAYKEPLSSLGEQKTIGIAVFSRTDRVTVNNYGVFVPLSVLGQDSSITHEVRREVNGGVRITILARPNGVRPNVRIGHPIDFTREQAWLKEHRNEYVGQWVALDGDRLLAHGTDARDVYDKARDRGVPVPSVVKIEASDELPFGGW